MTGKFYEADMGKEFIVVKYPDKAETGGISTCMGVGVLNHKTKKGYLGHYIIYDKTSESLINRSVNEAQDMGDLEVVLVGNIPLSEEESKHLEEDFKGSLESHREHGKWALEMIKSKGINLKNIQNYLQNYPCADSYEMIVDTEKVTIKVKEEELNI